MHHGRPTDLDGHWNHNTAYFDDVIDAMPNECGTALDIGCGDGLLARVMAQHAQQVIGIDPDDRSIAEARELSADHDNIDFIEGDFLAADLEEDTFDFIAAVASLHHMPADEALPKVKALLRPGGTLYVVGVARSKTPPDFGYDVVGTIANRVAIARRGYWQHSAPVAEPEKTYKEMRGIAEDQLHGGTFRRRLYYRYTIAWTRPK